MAQSELYAIYTRHRPRPSSIGGSAAFDRDKEDGFETKLEFKPIDANQAAELSNSPDHEVAPVMAAALIAPVADRTCEDADFWGVDAVGAPASRWNGAGVRAAMLDSGIDATHPAFAGVEIEQRDFTGSDRPGDPNGHGTHGAGIFFGRDLNGQRIGVAPGIERVLSARVLDEKGRGSTDGMLKGLRWAIDAGANVISVSLGLDYAGEVAKRVRDHWPPELAASRALEAFRENVALLEVFMADVRARRPKGTDPLIVAAAGNDSRLDLREDFRMGCVIPAAITDMSVGAVALGAEGLKIASFSNGPPTLVAPGVNVASAWPGGGLRTASGTSTACPHVAGCAALWWQYAREQEGGASGDTVRSHLVARSRRTGFADAVRGASHGRGLASAPT